MLDFITLFEVCQFYSAIPGYPIFFTELKYVKQ